MAVKVKVTSRTKEVSKDIRAAVEKGLTAAALLVEGDAKLRAPVDTGNLRSSINHQVDGDRATVGTNVEYAPHVEYGTSRQSAQPYLEPALRDNKDKISKIIRDAIRQGVK